MFDEPGCGAFDGPATVFLKNHCRVQPNHSPLYILFSKHRPHHLDNLLRQIVDMLLQVIGFILTYLTHSEVGKTAIISILGSIFDRLFNVYRVVPADAQLEPIFLKKKQQRWVMAVIADSEELVPMSFDAWTNQPLTAQARDWMKVRGITEVNDIAPVKFMELINLDTEDHLRKDEAMPLRDIFS